MCTSMAGPTDHSDDEGIWDSGSDDGHSADRRELHREAATREQQFYNGGYRDGLDIGKEQTLQEGFNIGFREGAAAGFEWGLLQGAAKTLAAFDGQAAGTRNLHSQIVSLSKAADLPARNAMLGLFRHLLSQPMPRHHAEEDAAGTDGKGQAAAAAAEASGRTAHAPGSVPDGPSLAAASTEAGASGRSVAEEGPVGEKASSDAAAGQRREAEGIADSLGALEVTAAAGPSGGGAGAGASGATGDGPSQARVPASALPEDALVMRLPDMPVVMRELRRQLVGMGFDVGGAPRVPLSVVLRRAVAAQDQEEDEGDE